MKYVLFIVLLFFGVLSYLVKEFSIPLSYRMIDRDIVKSDIYKVRSINKATRHPKVYDSINEYIKLNLNIGSTDNWRRYHLSDYLVHLPYRNPLFDSRPLIKLTGSKYNIGIKVSSSTGENIMSLILLRPFKLKFRPSYQKLLNYKFFEQYQSTYSINYLSENLFTKEIIDTPKTISEAYSNLLLKELRSRFFKKEPEAITTIKSLGLHIVDYKTKKEDLIKFCYIKKSRMLYPIIIRIKKNNKSALMLFKEIISKISIQSKSKNNSRFIINEFQSLNYKEKVKSDGGLLLFSAWTQDQSNTDILEYSISVLSRGNENLGQLLPLYDFLSKEKLLKQNLNFDFKKEKSEIKQKKKTLLQEKEPKPKLLDTKKEMKGLQESDEDEDSMIIY